MVGPRDDGRYNATPFARAKRTPDALDAEAQATGVMRNALLD